LALIPAGAFAGAVWTDIAGAVLGGFLIVREYVATRPRADLKTDLLR
jgi:hypothetical protein